MWWASVRDIQWRRRRFTIGVIGAAVAFAMALVLSGLTAGWRAEPRRTMDAVGGDGWVMADGATGPITSVLPLSEEMIGAVRDAPGVEDADGIVYIQSSIKATKRQVFLFGSPAGGIGVPAVDEGRAVSRVGEVVADASLGVSIGERIVVGGKPLLVVGRTTGRTLLTGIPDLFVTMEQAQAIAFEGAPLVSAVLVNGQPKALPAGTQLLTRDEVVADALSPMQRPLDAMDMIRNLLWLVAAIIVGSIVYLTALERVRDFAVLKAVGTSSRTLVAGLALQATLLSVVASVIATGIGLALEPVFPMPVEISGRMIAMLPAVAVGVGLLASLAGLRRVVSSDPVAAFGGA